VRMSGDLHQQLAQAAEREQVSLNRYVTDALAESVTGESAQAQAAAPTPEPDSAADGASTARDPRRTLRMVLAANLVVVVLAGTVAVVLLVLAIQQSL
jgi:hypothetical protein